MPDDAPTSTTQSAIALFCTVGDHATQPIPDRLSVSAAQEIQLMCGRLSQAAENKIPDIQTLAAREYAKLSDGTKREIADTLARLGNASSTGGASGPLTSPNATPLLTVSNATAGSGLQARIPLKKLLIPVRYANTADVHLLVNYDLGQVNSGNIKPIGLGVEGGYKGRSAEIDAAIFVDTSTARTAIGGYVQLTLTIPGT